MPTRKRILFDPAALDTAKAVLGDMARQPPPKRLTTAELIAELVPQIRKLKQLGYSMEMIGETLTKSGVQVSGAALAKLAAAKRRKKTPQRESRD